MKRTKLLLFLLLITILSIGLTACSKPAGTSTPAADTVTSLPADSATAPDTTTVPADSATTPDTTTVPADSATAPDTTAAPADSTDTEEPAVTYPLTITDQAGRSVTIEAQPQTLVSGYYISTSTLLALGLKDKLVGIEAKADKRNIYKLAAPELISLPNVGSAKEFDLEACVSLKADLTILPKKLKNVAEELEGLGLTVMLVNPESTAELNEMIELLGLATGAVDESQQLLDSAVTLQADLLSRLTGSAAPTVYMASNSALLETAGKSMYQSAMIENAGGKNVAAEIDDSYWAVISYEQLLAWDPDYIIIAAEAKYTPEDVLSDPILADCTAVKDGHVFAMPCDIEAWDSPVPAGLLGSIYVASHLHPDLVDSTYYEDAVATFYQTFYGFTK